MLHKHNNYTSGQLQATYTFSLITASFVSIVILTVPDTDLSPIQSQFYKCNCLIHSGWMAQWWSVRLSST